MTKPYAKTGGTEGHAPRWRMLLNASLLWGLSAVVAHAAGVRQFSPQGDVSKVGQVVVQFDAAAVRFGDPKAAAPVVHKLLSSAIANALNNNEMDRKSLYVAEVYANPGPTLKRYVARSRGSASPVLKRTSHISVVLDQK